MLRKLVSCALLLPLAAAVGGCLYETTLDAKGGGTMTATFIVDKQEFPRTQKQMESSAVKLTSSELVTKDGKPTGFFKLSFGDVTKLATTQYFRNLKVTRGPGSKTGTTAITAKLKQPTPLHLPDAVAARFGKEVKVVVTFPGPVVESNGTVAGNTVTWQWPIKEFFDTAEVVMSATYSDAGDGAAAAASDAGTPSAGAGDKRTPSPSTGKAKSGT